MSLNLGSGVDLYGPWGAGAGDLGQVIAALAVSLDELKRDQLRGVLAKAVATASVVMSGLPVVDGYQTVPNDVVLLVGQTDASQNGPWLVGANGWSRPVAFGTGALVDGATVLVTGGTVNAGTLWALATTRQIVVDRDAQAWISATVSGLAAALASVVHLVTPDEYISGPKDVALLRSDFRPVDARARKFRGAVPVGVIGNNAAHTLAEYYASLSAAQVDFPDATALAQNVDPLIINQAVKSVPMGTYSGGEVLLRDGIYVCGSTPIVCVPPPLSATPTSEQKKNRRITFGGDSMATRITFANTGGPGLLFRNCSRSLVHDLWLTAGGGITDLMLISVMDPDGSLGYGTRTCENFTAENMYLDGSTNGVTQSYVGVGTDTGSDVSEIVLRSIFVTGGGGSTGTNDWTAFLVGNGGTGNVLDVKAFGLKASNVQYGLIVNGGDFRAWGFDTQYCNQYVLWFKVGGRSVVTLSGIRDENSGHFLRHSFGAGAPATASVRDFNSHQLLNTDGIGLLIESLGVLTLEDGNLEGLTVPQRLHNAAGSAGFPTNVSLKDVALQGDRPLGSVLESGSIIRNVSGLVTGGPNTSPVVLPGNTVPRQTLQKYYNPKAPAAAITPVFDRAVASSHEVYLRQALAACSVKNLSPGQRMRITFVQDGTGGWSYAWPPQCMFAGAAPTPSTTAKARDSVEFEWTGRYLSEVSRSLNQAPPTIPAVNVSDLFDRDTSLTYRVGPSTSGHTPEVTQGAFRCDGTQLVPLVFTGPLNDAEVVWETGRADGTKQVDIVHGAGASTGLILRQADENNFLYVWLADTVTRVTKYQNGSATTINSTAVTHVAGTTYTLQVVFAGSLITYKENGVTIASFNIAADDQLEFGSNTKAGIFVAGATTSRLKNFSAAA